MLAVLDFQEVIQRNAAGIAAGPRIRERQGYNILHNLPDRWVDQRGQWPHLMGVLRWKGDSWLEFLRGLQPMTC